MFSKAFIHGIKAALYLAGRTGPEYVTVRQISMDLGLPESALAKTLQLMASAGYIDTVRGPKGGCRWSGRAVSLGDLATLLDRLDRSSSCCLDLHVCNSQQRCPVLRAGSSNLFDSLNDTFVGELVDLQFRNTGPTHLSS